MLQTVMTWRVEEVMLIWRSLAGSNLDKLSHRVQLEEVVLSEQNLERSSFCNILINSRVVVHFLAFSYTRPFLVVLL